MNKFATKKKLLAAESEVYRQLLRLEIQTFKVYGVRTKRKLISFSTYLPLLTSGLPMLSGLFRRRKRSSLGGIASLVMAGFKAYQQFAPMFGGKKGQGMAEPEETAAEEYLSDRL